MKSLFTTIIQQALACQIFNNS